ncbi:diacylglycerol/lipid kinase family protein [Thalassoglobus polymorphus]|uniref:Diacylglycerol kinase n=1 Tax=Thalassoglobus polymorphus TaxID=2527994 RepID=A0A517QUJ7_9PLAN|nr:diacylglycerol kinase family protein [Thalassoglobus polymorphus]QDT35281.1 Diacylglycerol kinase [Thalassoglobus polymorphus]
MKRSIHVIWNRHASQAEKYAELLETFNSRSDVVVLESESSDHAREYAAKVSQEDARVIVAAGGDGTVNTVMEGLLASDQDIPLGVLPLGTGNDFSRNTQIPWNPVEAFSLIEQREPTMIDVIEVRSEAETFHYLNMATAGNTGLYSDWITDEMKKFWGPLVYLRGAVDLAANLQVFDVELEFDNTSSESFQALNLFLANGSVTGGGLPVAPDAKINDGLIDVILVLDCTPVAVAGLVTQYTLSDYLTNENIVYRRCQSVSIKSSPPLTLTADGDTRSDQPVTVEVLPQRLPVITGL